MDRITDVNLNWKNKNLYQYRRPVDDCMGCSRRTSCLAGSLGSSQLLMFNNEVGRLRPYSSGQNVYSAGEAFRGLYVVKSGFFKSNSVNRSGELQITGFHLPGEIFGIEGFASGRYNYSVEALETGTVCRIPFSVFEHNNSSSIVLVRALAGLMSSAISHDNELIFSLAKMSAARRLAVFLVDLAARMQRAGFSEKDLTLCMRRTDIGNYLGLAEETVSRIFTRFQKQGVLTVNRRYIEEYNLEKLKMIARDEMDGELKQLNFFSSSRTH